MIVSRMFTSADDAKAAVNDLTQVGFRHVAIRVIDNIAGKASAADLVQQGVSEANAPGYEHAVSQGGALVLVEAPPGAAGSAAAILERGRPGDQGSPRAEYEAATLPETAQSKTAFSWYGPTPLSTALNWPVLSNDPTPLSNYLKRPVLSADQTPKAKLSDNPVPLSSRIGMKLLSDNATPLSSVLGMRLLSDNPTPLSSWLNKKVLSDNPTPLSTWLNKKVLLDNPTPLSSWLGWKVLSNRDTPPKSP